MAGENGGFISGGYNPLEAPDAPTSVSGTAGNQSIEIAFTLYPCKPELYLL